MAGLKHTMAAIPGGNTRRTFGTAYWDGSEWLADLGGPAPVHCRWADPIQPYQGAPIVVDISTDEYGQSLAFVSAMYTDQPRPTTGTVTDILPAGPAVRVVFTGEDGKSYTTDQFSGSYNIGDPVYVTWAAGKPMIVGKIGAITEVPRAEEPRVPEVATSGEVTVVATASDTFGVGGWGRWASSQRGGEDVYSGTQSGYTVTGSWFYGAPNPELAGKTVTRVQFRLPARMAVGASNSSVTVHLYAHTSGARPGGDVNRVVGPFSADIPAGYSGGWIDLPLTFAVGPGAGGGISIAGNPYVAFNSRLDDPESGKAIITWSS